MKNFLKISLIIFLSVGPVFGQNITVFDFTQNEFDNLEKRKVKVKLFGHLDQMKMATI